MYKLTYKRISLADNIITEDNQTFHYKESVIETVMIWNNMQPDRWTYAPMKLEEV